MPNDDIESLLRVIRSDIADLRNWMPTDPDDYSKRLSQIIAEMEKTNPLLGQILDELPSRASSTHSNGIW